MARVQPSSLFEKLLLTSDSVFLVVQLDGVCIYVSPTAEAAFGVEPAEVVGCVRHALARTRIAQKGTLCGCERASRRLGFYVEASPCLACLTTKMRRHNVLTCDCVHPDDRAKFAEAFAAVSGGPPCASQLILRDVRYQPANTSIWYWLEVKLSTDVRARVAA